MSIKTHQNEEMKLHVIGARCGIHWNNTIVATWKHWLTLNWHLDSNCEWHLNPITLLVNSWKEKTSSKCWKTQDWMEMARFCKHNLFFFLVQIKNVLLCNEIILRRIFKKLCNPNSTKSIWIFLGLWYLWGHKKTYEQ